MSLTPDILGDWGRDAIAKLDNYSEEMIWVHHGAVPYHLNHQGDRTTALTKALLEINA